MKMAVGYAEKHSNGETKRGCLILHPSGTACIGNEHRMAGLGKDNKVYISAGAAAVCNAAFNPKQTTKNAAAYITSLTKMDEFQLLVTAGIGRIICMHSGDLPEDFLEIKKLAKAIGVAIDVIEKVDGVPES